MKEKRIFALDLDGMLGHEENNHDQCIAAIKYLTNNTWIQFESKVDEYLNFHSINNFKKKC